ncbi:CD81 antigen-like [Lampetra planeri]
MPTWATIVGAVVRIPSAAWWPLSGVSPQGGAVHGCGSGRLLCAWRHHRFESGHVTLSFTAGLLRAAETQLQPASCRLTLCPPEYTKNCVDEIRSFLGTKVYIVAGLALGVAVIMIFGMIFSMAVCCAIRNDSPY